MAPGRGCTVILRRNEAFVTLLLPYVAQRALAAAEASEMAEKIAVANWCLGKTLFHVSEYSSAFEHLKKAYNLFGSPGDLQWQKLGANCGPDLIDCGAYELSPEEAIKLAYDVEERYTALSDNLTQGRIVLKVGFALKNAKREQEAMHCLYRAKTLLEAAESAPDIAKVYQIIGRLYHQKQQIPEALQAMERAWMYAVGYVSFDLGTILYSANRDADARERIKIALMLALQVGATWEVATSLEYVGYGYLRRGDYSDAYSAYSAAAEKYVKCGQDYHLERCHANLGRITQKLSNPNEELGFERPSWEYNKSLLHPLGGPVEPNLSLGTPSVEVANTEDS